MCAYVLCVCACVVCVRVLCVCGCVGCECVCVVCVLCVCGCVGCECVCVVCVCVCVCVHVCVCACVMCNWYASSLALFGGVVCLKIFSIEQGVRQGVLSPYLLFTLCAVCVEGLCKQSRNMSQNIACLASSWSKNFQKVACDAFLLHLDFVNVTVDYQFTPG